ncbi:MAG: methylmalonyl Co-A mutase-associated GTPase MeaB [Pseudomonadota bacterium]
MGEGLSFAEDLAMRVTSGDRRALARAITLVESSRADHRQMAQTLLSRLSPRSKPALRVGLTGTPGVGKSSFIEALGLSLIAAGHTLAVVAVDPSSARSGGSILGDKTRMEQLSRSPRAFIRPTPSQATLGGVGRHTRETILLVEAWGADVVLVETVGVGQSETMVADMTDIFVLLLAPAGGDELQGVKRGIMEMADLILVNKADGDLKPQATRTCADYQGALRLLRARSGDPEGFPRAQTVSAASGDGLLDAWEAVETLAAVRQENGFWQDRRASQALTWFDHAIEAGLIRRLERNPSAADHRARLAQEVASGRVPPDIAAETLLDGFAPNSTG